MTWKRYFKNSNSKKSNPNPRHVLERVYSYLNAVPLWNPQTPHLTFGYWRCKKTSITLGLSYSTSSKTAFLSSSFKLWLGSLEQYTWLWPWDASFRISTSPVGVILLITNPSSTRSCCKSEPQIGQVNLTLYSSFVLRESVYYHEGASNGNSAG